MNNDFHLKTINIEVTNTCPLHCPQCYCTLEGGKNLPLEKAVDVLKQAKELGLRSVELSGGETLCYPNLIQLVRAATDMGIESNIAISGWDFREETLDKLIAAGITQVFISLNGPTEAINALSRDGYSYAINALELLNRKHFQETHINWVMHRNTADYLQDMIQLARRYSVKTIVIMAPKPTSKHELNTFPTKEQMINAAKIIKKMPTGFIRIESCFSPLAALTLQMPFLGNLNTGLYKGCGAGRFMMSVSVDGSFSPCRHLEYYEKANTLKEYWLHSETLQKIRYMDNIDKSPCCNCKFGPYCRSCLAVNEKLHKCIELGYKECPVYTSSDDKY